MPTEKLAAGSKVRDVRFADDGDAERVIVDVGGKSGEATVLRADDHGAVLKIAGASLPKKLERTLDASAFAGPIRSVSTYADPDDAGAVRVEVALADGAARAAEAGARRGHADLGVPARGHDATCAPTKVAGYSAPMPLQVAPATTAHAGGPRRCVGRATSYTGRRIDLDFKDADIHNILRLLADVGHVNIVTARRRHGHGHDPHAQRAVGPGARRRRSRPRASAWCARAT